jgi:hypothetical protein
VAYGVTAMTTVITFATRLNPIWLFLAAGALGYGGLI